MRTCAILAFLSAAVVNGASSGACDPNGRSADLSRDRDTSDGSRWSCSEDLEDEQCTITYEFDEPQDIVHLSIAFNKGDERIRTLAVTVSDGFYQGIESSGTTGGYERFVVNTDETAWMTMESMDLDGDEWISIKRGAVVDASRRTTVTQEAIAYDERIHTRRRKMSPTGLPRRFDARHGHRRRLPLELQKETLEDEQYKITYMFGEPQTSSTSTSSSTRKTSATTLKVSASGSFQEEVTSNGTTDGWERFEINTEETAELTLESLGLGSDDWISLEEEGFMVE
eukprot:g10933.t1